MHESIQHAIEEHFSYCRQFFDRKPPEIGVSIDAISEDGHCVDLLLTFKAGKRYCCVEPNCHFGLHSFADWDKLHQLFVKHKAEVVRPTMLRLRGIVEQGAFIYDGSGIRKPQAFEHASQAFEYVHDLAEIDEW